MPCTPAGLRPRLAQQASGSHGRTAPQHAFFGPRGEDASDAFDVFDAFDASKQAVAAGGNTGVVATRRGAEVSQNTRIPRLRKKDMRVRPQETASWLCAQSKPGLSCHARAAARRPANHPANL